MKRLIVASLTALVMAAGAGLAQLPAPARPTLSLEPALTARGQAPAVQILGLGAPPPSGLASPYAPSKPALIDLAEDDTLLALAPTPAPVPLGDGQPRLGFESSAQSAGCSDGCTSSRAWVHLEYLLWWIKNSSVGPLVGTAPGALAGGSEIPPGQLNILFGNQHLDHQAFSGVRLSAGAYFDDAQTVGFDVSGFDMERKSVNGTFVSGGDPLLGPTFASVASSNTLILVNDASPNVSSGTVVVQAPTHFWGADANLRFRTQPVFADRFHWLAGFRYFQLHEQIYRAETSMGLGPNTGSLIYGSDDFNARNQFYGAQVGFASTSHMGRYTLDLIGKLALGGTDERVNVAGFSTFILPGQPQQFGNGNILAAGTNIGRHRRTQFAVLPELTVNLGYEITRSLHATIGYNLLYVSALARPASQIDFGANPTQITFLAGSPNVLQGAARPAFAFHDDSFWAQGLNLGLEWSF